MARHLSEMMLIVRAQNQASGALRRVGRDMSMLGRHRALQLRQQKLLLNQQNLMRQRQRALNELNSIQQGTRAINMQKAALQLERQRNTIMQKRRGILADARNLTHAMSTSMERMQKVNNDLFRNETRRLQLANKLKRAQADEATALRNRKTLAAARGGAARIPKSEDIASKASIANARQRATIINRLLASNADKNRELAASGSQLVRRQQEAANTARMLGSRYAATGKDADALRLAQSKLAAKHVEEAARAKQLQSELRAIGQRYQIVNAQQKELARTIHMARWDRLSTLGRTVQHLGRVGQYATLVFGGGLAYAAHQAAQFESAVTKVATQTGKVDSNFGRTTATIVRNSKMLQRAFIDIQMDSTSSMDQINEAGYDLFSTLDQLGDSTQGLKRGVGILKLFSDAAIAGGTDINTVGDGVIATLSAFEDMPQTVGGVQKLLNRMFAAVRFGRMSFAEFAATLGTTTPAARAAGQTFDTLAGMIAFLSKPLGINKASVGFARLTEILARKKFVEGLKKAGVQITDTNGRMLQMPNVIDRIVKKFPELRKGGVKLMQFFKDMSGTEGTIQARRAFVFLAQDLDGYRRILRKTVSDNNEMDRSLKTMEQTTGVRWEKFMNQLRAAVLMIGAEVLPEILKLAPHIQRLVDWFTGLNPEVRKAGVHFAALAVFFTGVGSAVAFLLGPLIRLFAVLGKGKLIFATMAVGIAAATVAIGVLTGEWDTLNRIVDAFFGLTEQGAWGWVAMFAIASVGALKLAKAITAVRNAWIAASVVSTTGAATGGLAGIFSRGRRAGNDIKGIRAVAKESGKLKALLAGASIAAAGMGAPLLAVGGAIAVAAAGAFLWKRHMDGVRKAAQETRNLNLQAQAPGVAAGRFGQTGAELRDFRQAQIAVRQYDLQIKQLRASLKGLTGVEREQVLLNIEQANIDRARALQNLTTSYNNLRIAAGAFSDFLGRESVAYARIGEQQRRVIALQKERAQLLRVGYEADDPAIKSIDRSIEAARRNITKWSQEVANANMKAQAGFNKTLTVLQQMKLIPAQISPQMRKMAFDFTRTLGRMMTPGELRRFFKVALNLDTVPASNKMAQFIRTWQAKRIKMSADVKIATGQANKLTPQEILSQGKGPVKRGVLQIPATIAKLKLPPGFMGGLKIPPIIPKGKPGPARKTIENAFKAPIKQKIDVDIPDAGALRALGASISAGIQAGMTDATQTVRIKKITDTIVNTYERSFKESAEISSPSKRFARSVGKPIVDGILVGMLDKKQDIQKTAAIVMNLFNGAFLEQKQQKIEAIGDKGEYDPLKLKEYLQRQKDALAKYRKSKKEIDKIRAEQYGKKAAQMQGRQRLTFGDLLKDARGQVEEMLLFNKSIDKLRKRGAPVGLLNDLRALGVDGLKYIKLLADATPAQLKKYVRAWNQMQGQIRKSQYQSLEDIKSWKQATRQQLNDFKEQAANKLLDTWNELNSIVKNNFGPLFQGLEDKIGEGFKSATDEWKSQVDDYQSQIEDLQSQIREVHDSMQQALGQLFAGDFLQEDPGVASKREWGVALGFDDLLADLKGQVDKFNQWRTLLTSLAAKVPPELAAQLENLGPEAVDKLQILDSATSSQLAQYVSTWRSGQDAIGQATLSATKDLQTNIQNLTNVLANLVAPKPLSPQDVLNSLANQINGFNQFEGVLNDLRKKGLPEQLVRQLAEMGPDALPYLQALNNMTGTQLQQFERLWTTAQQNINSATDRLMQDQLNMWFSHGANIASAIIAGVASEQQALLDFFGNLFTNLLNGKMPNMPGVSGGPVNYLPGHANPSTPDPWQLNIPGRTASAPSSMTSGSAPQTNITLGPIIATQDESLEQVLSRSAFVIRNAWIAE